MTRNRASAKKAGSSFERAQADWLAERLGDDRIDRRVKNGTKDRGDVGGVRFAGSRVVVECKNTSRDNLPAWIKEAEIERGNDDALIGVVMHKKRGTTDPAEQYVSMTAETFAVLLERGVTSDASNLSPHLAAEAIKPVLLDMNWHARMEDEPGLLSEWATKIAATALGAAEELE